MAKYLVPILSNCKDLSREDEFNKWYNEIHIPDALERLGFIRATRYEQIFIPGTAYVMDNPDVVKAKYLSLYDIETDDIAEVMKASKEFKAKTIEKGRFSDLFILVTRGVYKPI